MTIAIYALCDGAGIRYIGRTCDVRQRYAKHLSERTSSPKCQWIVELLSRGERPALRILEEVPAHDADRAELRWIRRLHRRGFRLLNVGGTGRPRRPQLSPRPVHNSPGEIVESWRVASDRQGV